MYLNLFNLPINIGGRFCSEDIHRETDSCKGWVVCSVTQLATEPLRIWSQVLPTLFCLLSDASSFSTLWYSAFPLCTDFLGTSVQQFFQWDTGWLPPLPLFQNKSKQERTHSLHLLCPSLLQSHFFLSLYGRAGWRSRCLCFLTSCCPPGSLQLTSASTDTPLLSSRNLRDSFLLLHIWPWKINSVNHSFLLETCSFLIPVSCCLSGSLSAQHLSCPHSFPDIFTTSCCFIFSLHVRNFFRVFCPFALPTSLFLILFHLFSLWSLALATVSTR